MFFFDIIFERLNPDVVDSFNEVLNKYRSAIETFITKPAIYSESNIAFITEKYTRDRVFESYKLISKRGNSLFKGKLPRRYSYAQKKFIVENINTINNSYIIFSEERILADNVAFLQKRYPNAFRVYCKDNGIYSSRLSKENKKVILSNESVLAQEESKIIAQMQHEKLVSDFKKHILDQYPRKYHYKKFYSDYSSDKGMEYFLNHLVELDAFCKYETEVAPYKALSHYAKDFLLSESKKTDDYVYLTSSSIKFRRYAKTKIENEFKLIESTYPIGTKYYTESINSRCLWPYPKAHSAIFFSAILGNESRKSQWEIEQEQKKKDEALRNESIKLTTQYLCICNIEEVKKLQDLYSKVEEIKRLYPLGSKLFIENNPIKEDTNSVYSVTPTKVVSILNAPTKVVSILNDGEPAPIKGKSFVKYYSDFIQARKLIYRLQSLSEWHQKQLDFCKYVRNLRDEQSLPWGCYPYEFPFEGEIYDEASNFKTPNVKFKIWQFFIESFCSANLDYTLCPRYSLDNVNNESLESGQTTYKTWVYDKIKNFVASLRFEDYSPVVIFADTDERWEIYHKSTHFLYLRSILQTAAIPEYEKFGYILNQDKSKKIIVVVDLITTNNQLQSFASDIIGDIDTANLIVYISLRKEYSKEEMQSIIDAEQKKIDDKKAEEEREKKRKREEEERKRREEDEKREKIRRMKACVSDWHVTRYGFYHAYLYEYLKTTAPREADEYEWDIRHLIWAFKNDPNKQDRQYSYRAALNEIVPKYERKLRDTFGSLLSDMTLVCLPASNSEKNRRRWQEFSKKVCSDLDMWNAYDYIHIEQEAIPKHLGGDGQAVLSFNQSFFNGKYVILCDDIKTTGSSLQRMKYKLESMGATVICSLTIGMTIHE